MIDPEAMQEAQGMQEAVQMPNFEMPDFAEALAKFSTGGGGGGGSSQAKKR